MKEENIYESECNWTQEDNEKPLTEIENMKSYIVYVDGVETCYIKACRYLSAVKKAQKIFPNRCVDVCYTEL